MTCPHCQGADRYFDNTQAQQDLDEYRQQGAGGTTRRLIDSLTELGVKGLTLLDIGGGVGAIQHDLVAAGVERVVGVDASRAYLAAAEQEATQRGYADRAQYHHGDFVALADAVEATDIVTLDRAICCYPDVEALVGLSSAKARRYYGVVYPRDAWWTKWLAQPVMNLYFALTRNPFRFFVHSSATVERLVVNNGFKRLAYFGAGFWQVVIYQRE
jgi:hypothetical protein